jgi:Lrp/AsnC family leucine-responsive transcriptional regulator
MRHLDRTDRKILDILQDNNQLTYAALASLAAVSTSSCRRRVEALRRDGVIVADISIVDPEILGPRLKVTALVTLERDTPDGHQAFRQSMNDLPQVVQCQFVSGACDYVVQFSLESMEQYDRLLDRYFTAMPIVKRVESMVVLKDVKNVAGRRIRFADGP